MDVWRTVYEVEQDNRGNGDGGWIDFHDSALNVKRRNRTYSDLIRCKIVTRRRGLGRVLQGSWDGSRVGPQGVPGSRLKAVLQHMSNVLNPSRLLIFLASILILDSVLIPLQGSYFCSPPVKPTPFLSHCFISIRMPSPLR
jgi:hypothetical protein